MGFSIPVAPLRLNTNLVVSSTKFQNSGTSLKGRKLGYTPFFDAWTNAVEIQFFLNQAEAGKYHHFQLMQWVGPDKVSVKYDSPITSPWQSHSEHPLGAGRDEVFAENTVIKNDVLALYDNPGLRGMMFVEPGSGQKWPTLIYSIQNFTTWIEGYDSFGVRRRLCGVVAWYSILHLGNDNSENPTATPKYRKMGGTKSGTGWVSTYMLPPV